MSRAGYFFEGLNMFISSFQHRWSLGITAIHTNVRTLESKANLNSHKNRQRYNKFLLTFNVYFLCILVTNCTAWWTMGILKICVYTLRKNVEKIK
jgi:hypothetical protein